jgi:RHS repeat-associated protein
MVTSGGQTVTYGYHPASGLLGTTSYNGTTAVARVYDALGRTQSVTTTPASGVAQSYAYTYDSLSRRTRVTREDASYWAFDYNDRGELTSGKKNWPDNAPVLGAQTEYAFDNVGNRTASRAGGNASGALRQSLYTTNALNQYELRTVPGAADVAGTAHPSATVTVNGGQTARRGDYFYREMPVNNSAGPAYAQVGVVGARTNFGAGGEDAVTERGGRVFVPQAVEAYTYDADGNLTSDGRWNYTWDAENHLASMEAKPGVPAEAKLRLEFAYDWSGRRIRKQVYAWSAATGGYQLQSVSKFVYDGWNLAAELDGAGALVRGYVWGQDLSGTLDDAGGVGGLLLVRQGGDTYHVGYDGSGNATTLVNAATGAVAASYEFDPFGNTLKAVGEFAASNPFRFSTKYADAETGLVYYGERYYQPQTGRWLSRDPLGEASGPNVYAFVGNNPVSLVDPTGLYEEDVHFYLTYFLAMQVGCFDSAEAHWIADADQKADEDGDKAPATGHGWPGKILGPATSLFPLPFTEEDNEARERHRTYHALTDPWNHPGNIANLMRDTNLPFRCRRDKKKENDAVREQKLRNFGTALHYTQDTFSHRGYTSDNYGHGVEKIRGKQHMPDKTHGRGLTPIVDPMSWIPRLDARNQLQWEEYSRVDRAWEMVRDTWRRMQQWCSYNECFGSKKQLDQQQRNWETARPFIQQFLESNGTRNPGDGNANPNNRSISPAEMDFKRQILRVPRRHR